jgi:hypothetical protein
MTESAVLGIHVPVTATVGSVIARSSPTITRTRRERNDNSQSRRAVAPVHPPYGLDKDSMRLGSTIITLCFH